MEPQQADPGVLAGLIFQLSDMPQGEANISSELKSLPVGNPFGVAKASTGTFAKSCATFLRKVTNQQS